MYKEKQTWENTYAESMENRGTKLWLLFHCKCIKNLTLCKSRGNFHVVLKIIFPIGDYSVYPAQFFSDYYLCHSCFALSMFRALTSVACSAWQVFMRPKKQTKTNKQENKININSPLDITRRLTWHSNCCKIFTAHGRAFGVFSSSFLFAVNISAMASKKAKVCMKIFLNISQGVK